MKLIAVEQQNKQRNKQSTKQMNGRKKKEKKGNRRNVHVPITATEKRTNNKKLAEK